MGIVSFAERLGNRMVGGGSGSLPETKAEYSYSTTDYACFEIMPYKENELGFAHWEGFLANFSSMKEPIYFTVRGNNKSIRLFMYVPEAYVRYVENMFYSSFPTSEIKKQPFFLNDAKKGQDYLAFTPECVFYEAGDFSKAGSYVDPFKDVLSVFFSVSNDAQVELVYESVFKVKKNRWQKLIDFFVKKAKKVADSESQEDMKDEKQEKDVKKIGRDVKFTISMRSSGVQGLEKAQLMTDVKHVFDKFLHIGSAKRQTKKSSVNGNAASFINMFHIPTKTNHNPSLHYVEYRKLASPVNIPKPDGNTSESLTILGKTDYKGDGELFGIKKEDKFRHIYIVGKTGMGKSNFMATIVRSDLMGGCGLAVVDPHGDLVDDVMAHIPPHRINDVILFDVSDTHYPVGFNILEYNTPEEKNLVASAVVSIFKKLFANSRGPRLEYILRNVMLSILEYPNATLMHVVRMLTDKNFREEVIGEITDPVVIKFWRDEYDKWQDRQKNESIGPIANKIGQFLSSPIVRNIFAQPKSAIKIRKIMDEKKILLVNLSKGKIGEDNASMIGSFLVSKFQIDAMSRADVAKEEREDFYLFIDEFQNFATDSFESILSEARKYRLSLIVANQYTSQIQENVRDAIFGNVGTIISFGLGYDDATMMALQYKELISPNDLLSIPKYKAYIKLMVDGLILDPFTMTTLPLPDAPDAAELREKIRKQSRQRYATERDKLESLLKAWMQKQFTEGEKIVEQSKVMKDDGTAFTIDDLEIGKDYTGYVKLVYNFGIFVTVNGVEGLLHKSQIKMPKNVDPEAWKDLYTAGDKIDVYAQEYRMLDGQKRIVRSQIKKK